MTKLLINTLAAIAAGAVLATSAIAQNAGIPDKIEHHIAKVDGTRFHYVTAGTGDPVLLLPGWPESWIAWRKVVPLLVSAGRSVVVLDPRGFGESDKPADGYDPDTAAHDLHGFLVGLPAGPHKVEITLANANHQPLDRAATAFSIPETGSHKH
jgi:hypothetical protein